MHVNFILLLRINIGESIFVCTYIDSLRKSITREACKRVSYEYNEVSVQNSALMIIYVHITWYFFIVAINNVIESKVDNVKISVTRLSFRTWIMYGCRRAHCSIKPCDVMFC